MLSLLIYLLVAVLIIAVVWWIVDYAGVPEPINRFAKIAIIIIGAIIVLNVLLSLAGSPIFPMR